MNTAANVARFDSSHWYWPDGRPAYELPKKSGKGMKRPNITDARELGLVPGVTTVLNILNKPALNAWKEEQSVLACLTAPRKEGEPVDAFVKRVLYEEREGEQEAKAAADKGTAIHDAIECAINGRPFDDAWKPYVQAVFPVIESLGKIAWSEKHVVGDGYAGRADILLDSGTNLTLLDFKSAKTMPTKDSWLEHRLQTSAYAATLGNVADRHIITGNLYISTIIPGNTALFLQENWQDTYQLGFKKVLEYWMWANNYRCGRAE